MHTEVNQSTVTKAQTHMNHMKKKEKKIFYDKQ